MKSKATEEKSVPLDLLTGQCTYWSIPGLLMFLNFFGAGTIPLHRSEGFLRGWHPILSGVLKEWSLLLKQRLSQALSSCWGRSERCKILVFGQQQQHLSQEEIWVTREKGVKYKHGARSYPPWQVWWNPQRWLWWDPQRRLCWVMFASFTVSSMSW